MEPAARRRALTHVKLVKVGINLQSINRLLYLLIPLVP